MFPAKIVSLLRPQTTDGEVLGSDAASRVSQAAEAKIC
jgi:hypothetical protein